MKARLRGPISLLARDGYENVTGPSQIASMCLYQSCPSLQGKPPWVFRDKLRYFAATCMNECHTFIEKQDRWPQQRISKTESPLTSSNQLIFTSHFYLSLTFGLRQHHKLPQLDLLAGHKLNLKEIVSTD